MMAVSKRTRFEVLRRDGHACRYCGQCAPDVKLTVDHVTPVALGGADTPDNLVAACRDCNYGKASTSPDAEIVADVSAEQIRYAKLVEGAWAVRVDALSERDDWIEEVIPHMTFPGPDGWRASLGRFYEMGVPVEVAIDAAEKAAGKYDPYGRSDKFRYMCGILWRCVEEIGTSVRRELDSDGYWHTDEQLTNIRIESYDMGWEAGLKRGRRQGFARGVAHPTLIDSLLRNAIEGSHEDAKAWHLTQPAGVVFADGGR